MDDAAEEHVDGGSEEDRREEDEECLDNVRTRCIWLGFSDGSGTIANDLDCEVR